MTTTGVFGGGAQEVRQSSEKELPHVYLVRRNQNENFLLVRLEEVLRNGEVKRIVQINLVRLR